MGVGMPGQEVIPVPVRPAGGELLDKLLPEAITVYDAIYRKSPQAVWFDPLVSDQRPVQFEVGAFDVPNGQHYWLFDLSFTPYVFSGVDPGDGVPAEEGRFSSCMGFVLTVGSRPPMRLSMELRPSAVQSRRQAFESGNPLTAATADVFARARTNQMSAASAGGTSMLPPSRQRPGPRTGPVSFVGKERERVVVSCTIWRPLPAPLAWLEARHQGYFVSSNVSEMLLQRIRVR